MSGRTDDEEQGVGAGKGRRTRPWGPLRGPSEPADRLAETMRGWLDEAGLRLADLMGKLLPEHFASRTVPSRTAVADRLAGVNLQWDFVEAVADICARTRAERERWTTAARVHFEGAERAKRSGGAPGAGKQRRAGAGGATPTAELLAVQRQSLELSDQLFRALQRAVELEKARNDANHMVLILLTLVDKLQRDIATLTAQRNRSQARAEDVQERLRHSEAQRDQAESELARARAEREKADRLAELQAEQVCRLTDELARLREVHGAAGTALGEVLPTSEEPPADLPDDIEIALEKASFILDKGARDLDRLEEELQDESDGLSGPDNSPTSEDDRAGTTDNSPETVPDNPPDNSAESRESSGREPIVDRVLLAWEEGHPLPAPLLKELVQDGELGALVRSVVALEAMGGRDAVLEVLDQVGAKRPSSSLKQLVDQLREIGLRGLAPRVLLAAGRLRDIQSLPFLLSPVRLGSTDTVLVLKGVCDRPPEEIAEVARELALFGMGREAVLLNVVTAVPGGASADGTPLGKWGRTRWFTPRGPIRKDPAAPPPLVHRTTLTTRVRINIPGAREQPPIVLRWPGD
ncbi:hypothetical protein ACGFZQ_46850 [Streptomyces sp. NPDC048254]|uniref:hypothetical protein n=1 Tax=Streptomyces sp. NPDC048254 TaxID=3365525 RepID=UPI00371856D4